MTAEQIQAEILRQVAARGAGKTICPSEVARAMFPDDWRDHMDAVRSAAGVLASDGQIVVTQKGEPVDVDSFRGPIRLGSVSGLPASPVCGSDVGITRLLAECRLIGSSADCLPHRTRFELGWQRPFLAHW